MDGFKRLFVTPTAHPNNFVAVFEVEEDGAMVARNVTVRDPGIRARLDKTDGARDAAIKAAQEVHETLVAEIHDAVFTQAEAQVETATRSAPLPDA